MIPPSLFFLSFCWPYCCPFNGNIKKKWKYFKKWQQQTNTKSSEGLERSVRN